MDRTYRLLRDDGLVVVAVASDEGGAPVVEPFVRKLSVTFPVLLDPRASVSRQYGASALPSSFVLDRQGRVLAAARGERVWDSPQAVAYLRAVLGAD